MQFAMIKEFLQRLVFHSGIIKRLFFRKSYETLFKVGSNLKSLFSLSLTMELNVFMTHVFTIVDYRRNIHFL